jgi:hypothetical protein
MGKVSSNPRFLRRSAGRSGVAVCALDALFAMAFAWSSIRAVDRRQ